jgi:hypothetical protein
VVSFSWRTRPGLDLLAKSVCRQYGYARTNDSQTQVFANCWPTQFAMLANTTAKSEGCINVNETGILPNDQPISRFHLQA